jgi:hypothetical protein
VYCIKCGKPLRGGGQRFCPGCGHPVPIPAPLSASSGSRSLLSDPKVLVLVAAVILAIIAITALQGFSAFVAVVLIVIAGFGIFSRRINLRVKLFCLGIGFCIVLLSNGIELWHDEGAERQAAQDAREKAETSAAADAEAKQQQALAFNRLTPKEHLDKARALLTADAPQGSVDEGFQHLNAVSTSALEHADAQRLRHQYEAEKKKREAEQARVEAANAKKQAIEQAGLDRAARDAMATTLENRLLDEGYNVDVKAIGKDHTVLHLRWILVSKVLAHQLSEEGTFFSNARSVGFKKVEITDGYDETWYWKLD